MIFAFLNYHTVDYYFTLLFCLCQYIYLKLLSHNSTSVNGSLNTNIFNHIPAVVKCCKDRIDIIFFSISSKYVNFSDEITLPTQKLRKSPEFRLRYFIFVLALTRVKTPEDCNYLRRASFANSPYTGVASPKPPETVRI